MIVSIDEEKISIFKKIQKNSKPIKKLADYWYGKGGMTPHINKNRSGIELLTGKQIFRYGENINIKPWFLDKKHLTKTDKYRINLEKVVVQDIVAHITKPVPHIKLAASLDTKKRFCLNTVMCFAENEKGLKNMFLLALLNSKLMSFYYYYFIFNQAVRTMHFMPGYADYVPIPNNFLEFQDALIKKCAIMLENRSQPTDLQKQLFDKTNDEINHIIYTMYDLTREEIEFIEKNVPSR